MRDDWAMSDERPTEVLASLPRTRPHRRSAKRAHRPASHAQQAQAATTPQPEQQPKPRTAPATRRRSAPKRRTAATGSAKQRLAQPAQPGGTPVTKRRTKQPAPPPARSTPGGADVLGTAVQAAAELAEIGLSVSARALRRAVSRLPRP